MTRALRALAVLTWVAATPVALADTDTADTDTADTDDDGGSSSTAGQRAGETGGAQCSVAALPLLALPVALAFAVVATRRDPQNRS